MDRTAVMPLAAMHAQDWAALSDLLDQALDLPPAEREAWLNALDGEHLIHREALRALLATQAEIETGDFLAELPALPGVASEAGEARAGGQLVGAYRLIERIGRGGMGEVWLAERADGTVRRQVALKLPHAVWGDAFTERLVREREILAALDHAHIARLYDAGVDAHGRPFLAMAYVAGQPIDVYCRERALPLRSRVALLLQVAAAVAHAHARLVVHRDLKPGNILVGADGNVVLLDFGIAKLLDGDQTRDTALTAVSGRALTLDYASPEQIRGEPLGTASDVYSLAVVAYELLAGGRPYRLARGSAAELEEAIASAQAPRASDTAMDASTRRQLRGDLDAILNKALKKRPEERYATMDAFAADLRRWRDGEPVQARPDSAGYRMAKFIGRHRLQVAAGGGVMLALAGGASVALWQAHEARLAAAQARTEAATAKAVQGFMESVFISNSANQADPERARATTARELLDRGAERIEKDLAQAPEAQLRLYELLGEMYFHMALNDRSLALRRSGAALAARHFGAGSLEAINASVSLAKTLAEVGAIARPRSSCCCRPTRRCVRAARRMRWRAWRSTPPWPTTTSTRTRRKAWRVRAARRPSRGNSRRRKARSVRCTCWAKRPTPPATWSKPGTRWPRR
jgi:eukaryotic-like serine/threonine-protein kinase